jgi:TolC family type I secretion outer membrane protein
MVKFLLADVPRFWNCFLVVMICLMVAGSVSAASGTIELADVQILDLETAQQIAVRDNPSLSAAEARVRQARERLRQARSSYWPHLSARGGATYSVLSDTAHSAALVNDPGADDATDTYSVGLSATWTLFDGFSREYSNLRARHGMESTEKARKDALRLLLSAVAASYYNAQLALENISIAEANESFNRRQLVEAEARYRVGTGSLSDVLNFEVQINSAKANLIAAKKSYHMAAYGLAALMGVSDATLPGHVELAGLEEETREELVSADLASQVQYALEHRPDVQKAEHAVAQSKAAVGVARSGFYPTVSLTGGMDAAQQDSMDFGSEDFGKSVGLNFSYSLFAGGLNRAKVAEARSGLTESENSLEDAMISVQSEVASAVTALASAQEQLLLQRSNAKLVQQVRDLVEKEYAAGEASLVRLNEAQKDLVTAQGNLALSLVSMRQAWENLRASTGEILMPGE